MESGASATSRSDVSSSCAGPDASPCPHCPQNLNWAGFEAPQALQIRSTLEPQYPQKTTLGGFSLPQLGHWTTPASLSAEAHIRAENGVDMLPAVRFDVLQSRRAFMRAYIEAPIKATLSVTDTCPLECAHSIDFHEMATLEYDITHYQPILFACDGMGELTQRVGGFFADFDDDTPARLAPRSVSLGT